MNYYILRHGETLVTKMKLEYGDTALTAEIIPDGIPTIQKLSEYLKTTDTQFNVSSNIIRCRQTVEIINQITGKEFVFDVRLNEYYQENFPQLEKRIREFLDEIKAKDYQTVLICTHGAVIAGLIHLLTDGTYSEYQIYDHPRPGVLVQITGDGINYIDFNKNEGSIGAVDTL